MPPSVFEYCVKNPPIIIKNFDIQQNYPPHLETVVALPL